MSNIENTKACKGICNRTKLLPSVVVEKKSFREGGACFIGNSCIPESKQIVCCTISMPTLTIIIILRLRWHWNISLAFLDLKCLRWTRRLSEKDSYAAKTLTLQMILLAHSVLGLCRCETWDKSWTRDKTWVELEIWVDLRQYWEELGL